MYVNTDNSFISDNPYYFYNDNKTPRTPESPLSKGFSFFKRRNSKGNSSLKNTSIPLTPTRSINSATLTTDATESLGSPRGSLNSLGISLMGAHTLENNNSTIYRRSLNRDRLGSFNESIHYHSEIDDVFDQNIRSDLSRTLPLPHSTRRHSFGHFNNRTIEQRRCTPISDEVPKMIAPKPPIVSPTKYRPKRKENCTENCNMDDILIITAKHSEKAISWASFLKTRFDKITKQRGRKPFNFLHVKIGDGSLSNDIIKKYKSTALQIIILCPAFLALPHQLLMAQLSAILNIEKVLAILLSVAEDKVLEINKLAFPSYRKWKRCTVHENDQSAIGNILGIATDILGRALCQRPPCYDSLTRSASNSSDAFSVVPRKVKIGQNKVLALLNDPIAKDDWIKITIEKSGETFEVKSYKQRNPFTIQFNIPENCMEISTMVEIKIEKNDRCLGSRPVKCESRLRELEQLLRSQDSPIEFMCHSLGIGLSDREALDKHLLKCFQRNMPLNFHLLAGPYEKTHQCLLLKDNNAEEYPTLLHFAAKWGLDQLSMQLLECPGGEAACEIRNYMGRIPHEIAEQEGHHDLAKSLKSFAQMHEFSTMYHYFKGITDSNSTKVVIDTKKESSPVTTNSPRKVREEIKTIKEKQLELKQNESIRQTTEYLEMSSGSENEQPACRPKTLAVTNLNYINIDSKYDDNLQSSSDEMVKNMDSKKIITDAEITNELKICEPPYYQSNENNKNNIDNRSTLTSADQFSQECSNLLENCNISNNLDYMMSPSNIPVQQNADYMIPPSNKPVDGFKEAINYVNDTGIFKFDESHLRMHFEKKTTKPSVSKNGTLKRTGSDASSTKTNADDELVEIMYDFKNNVLSIREVEQLVEKWKNRNDVQQSFKEKQQHITKLREEYEKIQDQMKEKFKRPTPFERVKKLFSRNKSNASANKFLTDDFDETKSSLRSFQSSQRPMSSLSMQSVSSTSSSGRMSTGSACSGTSLGDSGTHSDHEDRRQIYVSNNSCRIGSPGSLMENYLIPPAPRPVLTPVSTPGEDKERITFTSVMASPITNSEYCIFPSNIPVNQDNQIGLNTIDETKETTNDFITVTPIKIQNDKNIIYGKLHKTHPKEIYSSFKPNHYKNNSKKDMTEVLMHNNININEKQKNIFKNPEHKLISRPNSSENNNLINGNNSKDNDSHNYINI